MEVTLVPAMAKVVPDHMSDLLWLNRLLVTTATLLVAYFFSGYEMATLSLRPSGMYECF